VAGTGGGNIRRIGILGARDVIDAGIDPKSMGSIHPYFFAGFTAGLCLGKPQIAGNGIAGIGVVPQHIGHCAQRRHDADQPRHCRKSYTPMFHVQV